jgi:hypothetical protein
MKIHDTFNRPTRVMYVSYGWWVLVITLLLWRNTGRYILLIFFTTYH